MNDDVVMVTGAGGFLGKAFCAALAITNKVCRPVYRNRFSLLSACEDVVYAEITPDTNWQSSLMGVEAVVHLAAQAHTVDAFDDYKSRDFLWQINASGTINLAKQAAAAGVRRFVFVSSIKVNGERTLPEQPFTEKDSPAPQGAYALSKLAAELGLMELAAETGMEVVIVRPPLVYGPGVKANFLSMMRCLARGVPLPLGAIHNRRSFVALDNLVDLLTTCLDHPAAANQVFFASDCEDMSTSELLQRTAAALGKTARLLPVPQKIVIEGLRFLGRADLAERLCGSLQVDSGKVRRLLGWQPPVGVDESLRNTAQYFWEHQWR